MKLTKKTFKINSLYDIKLDRNLHFYNLNIKTICYYINFKTYMLNKLRKNLLFEKIEILKNSKNLLLQVKYNYEKENNEYKNTNICKIFNKFFYTKYLNKKENKNKKTIIKNRKTDLIIKEKWERDFKFLSNFITIDELHKSQFLKYDNRKRFIENLKDTIKKIDKAIKKYQIEQKHNKDHFSYKINSYDLYMLNQYKITSNIQKVIYYYLIKLKKSHISKKSLNALRNPIFQKLVNDYSANLQEMQKDFIDIIKPTLKSYAHKFLYKTI